MQPNAQKSQHSFFNSRPFAVIILCCLGIIIYSNALDGAFHFDDIQAIVQNEAITDTANITGEIWHSNPRRFITNLSLVFNYKFDELNVFGYHLFNIIVHLGCAILVWWLSLLTLEAPVMKGKKIAGHANIIAFFAGLVFVAHPIQTQAVTYIIQRATALATLFYLASLCLYVKSRLLQFKNRAPGVWGFSYVGSVMAAGLAIFTKEMALTLPFMILLYEFYFLNTKEGISWKRLMPFFVMVAIMLTAPEQLAAWREVLRINKSMFSHYYRLTQFKVMITYIRLLFIPFNQNLDYAYPIAKTILEPAVLASLLALGIILAIAIRAFSNYRLISFCIFWFFLSLLPSSVISREDIIFEHRLYLSMVGYSLFLVSALYYLVGRKNLRQMITILLMIVTCYSTLTYQRNFVWKNEISLWADTVRKSPCKGRPLNNLGNAYAEVGDFDRAIDNYNKAIIVRPRRVEAVYNNRANAYKKKGDLDCAIANYNKAIQIHPGYLVAYYNRGNAYAQKGDFAQAINDYNKVIEIHPSYSLVYYSRGYAYENKGDLEKAIADYDRAISINPVYGYGYCHRARAYFKKKEYRKVKEDISKAEEFGVRINKEFFKNF